MGTEFLSLIAIRNLSAKYRPTILFVNGLKVLFTIEIKQDLSILYTLPRGGRTTVTVQGASATTRVDTLPSTLRRAELPRAPRMI